MQYTHLTPEHKKSLIDTKRLELEATYFKNSLELEIATATNAEQHRMNTMHLLNQLSIAIAICDTKLSEIHKGE